jgi:septal ring factor EnvC (AmiA/AmiB activator)
MGRLWVVKDVAALAEAEADRDRLAARVAELEAEVERLRGEREAARSSWAVVVKLVSASPTALACLAADVVAAMDRHTSNLTPPK